MQSRHQWKGGAPIVAIYARQSVERKDSLSIEGQIDLCRKQAGEEVKIYQDRGFSAKNTNRPAFQTLLRDVERGLVQKIIVYRLDRFSRSTADFGRLWELLQAHSVEFVSVSEAFDTSTPMGRAMLNIIMVFAQLERETTAERVRDNYYQRVELGAWPGGPAPFGFSLGREKSPSGKTIPTLIPNEQASLVEEIFTHYAEEDASLGQIARSLNARGIPASRRASWDNVTLSRILHSPLYVMADEEVYLYYKGKGVQIAHRLEDFDGLHAGMLIGKRKRSQGKYAEPHSQRFALANHIGIVPAQLWLSCQYKLLRNQQIGQAGKGKHTWLSGLLKCEVCGYSLKVNREGEKYYLICSGRSNLGLCDASIRVNLRQLEAETQAEIVRLLARCPPVPAPEPAASSAFAAQLLRIDERIDRLMAALAESTEISMQYINRELARLDRERESLLEEQAAGSQKEKGLASVDFPKLSFEEKKLVAGALIERVLLQGDSARIIWKV